MLRRSLRAALERKAKDGILPQEGLFMVDPCVQLPASRSLTSRPGFRRALFPQITRALNHDVTTSVTITTAKITARIKPTWSQ
ncbi:MAG: hypothetical protein RLZ83_860 [Pseudomonadota bacterium]